MSAEVLGTVKNFVGGLLVESSPEANPHGRASKLFYAPDLAPFQSASSWGGGGSPELSHTAPPERKIRPEC